MAGDSGKTICRSVGWQQDKSGIQRFCSPGLRSRIGCGILTFPIPCIFATEPGVDLYVTGPRHRPKDGIAP